MAWKNLPYWLKGGIIGCLIGTIIGTLLFFDQKYRRGGFIQCMFVKGVTGPCALPIVEQIKILVTMIVITSIIGLIIGALISLIVGKIKKE